MIVMHGVEGILFAFSRQWLDLLSFSFNPKSLWALCEL